MIMELKPFKHIAMTKILTILILGLLLTGCSLREPMAGVGAECLPCPPCDCKITAEKIIKDNPTIKLPDETTKFIHKGVEFTLEDIKEAKSLINK